MQLTALHSTGSGTAPWQIHPDRLKICNKADGTEHKLGRGVQCRGMASQALQCCWIWPASAVTMSLRMLRPQLSVLAMCYADHVLILKARICAGACGVVYKACLDGLHLVAVKLVRPDHVDHKQVEAFRNEVTLPHWVVCGIFVDAHCIMGSALHDWNHPRDGM